MTDTKVTHHLVNMLKITAGCSCGARYVGTDTADLRLMQRAHKASVAAGVTALLAPKRPQDLDLTISKLTKNGKAFMALVGNGYFDYFDDGIVEGGGNWGGNLADQAYGPLGVGRKSMPGIMSRLIAGDLDLWTREVHEEDNDTWWALTALGAAVALKLAGKDIFGN